MAGSSMKPSPTGTDRLGKDDGMKKGGKVKKYEDGGSIRFDRSPKYSDAEMAYVRKKLDDQEKADKPEHDKNVERYNKALDEVTKRTQPNMSNMNPMGDTYKHGGKIKSKTASKRADGCCVKGKTKGRMV